MEIVDKGWKISNEMVITIKTLLFCLEVIKQLQKFKFNLIFFCSHGAQQVAFICNKCLT